MLVTVTMEVSGILVVTVTAGAVLLTVVINLNFNSGNVNWQNNNNRLNGFPVRGVLVEHSFCLCAIDKTIAFFLCIH